MLSAVKQQQQAAAAVEVAAAAVVVVVVAEEVLLAAVLDYYRIARPQATVTATFSKFAWSAVCTWLSLSPPSTSHCVRRRHVVAGGGARRAIGVAATGLADGGMSAA
mmetsp:Transcript_10180/g.24366  ORF Transcript_10180/g.24366 Transcript_10180/m.24366 type:complete len:107 (+) Transcript_10180:646-966(+)